MTPTVPLELVQQLEDSQEVYLTRISRITVLLKQSGPNLQGLLEAVDLLCSQPPRILEARDGIHHSMQRIGNYYVEFGEAIVDLGDCLRARDEVFLEVLKLLETEP